MPFTTTSRNAQPPPPPPRPAQQQQQQQHNFLLLLALASSLLVGTLRTAHALLLGLVFQAVSRYGSSISNSNSNSTLTPTTTTTTNNNNSQAGGNDIDEEGLLLHAQISHYCAILACVGAGAWLANALWVFLWALYAERRTLDVRRAVFAGLMGKEMAWWDGGGGDGCGGPREGKGRRGRRGGLGSLLVKIHSHTSSHHLSLSLALPFLTCNLFTALSSLSIALFISWRLTLVLLSTVPLTIIILSLLNRKIRAATRRHESFPSSPSPSSSSSHSPASSSSNSYSYSSSCSSPDDILLAAIRGLPVVQLFDGHDSESWRYRSALRRLAAISHRPQSLYSAVQAAWVKLWVEALFTLGFFYGRRLVVFSSSSSDGDDAGGQDANGQGSWWGPTGTEGRKDTAITPGQVMTTFYAAVAALQALEASVPMYLVWSKGRIAKRFLASLMVGEKDVTDEKEIRGVSRPPTCEGELKIDQVTFAYPSRPSSPVLNGASLVFPAGSLCFVVGPSGSGKSTLAALCASLYNLTGCDGGDNGGGGGGDILIDGRSLRVLDPDWVRQNVTLVEQTSSSHHHLFHDTLRANLRPDHYLDGSSGSRSRSRSRRGDDGAHLEELDDDDDDDGDDTAVLLSVCDALLLGPLVTSQLPQGLETMLGGSGGCTTTTPTTTTTAATPLSGGERQRVAVARALLRDTPILILDEAATGGGLDPAARVRVMGAVRRWRRGKTTVVITHHVVAGGDGDGDGEGDQQLVWDDDFVYVLDGGRVIQQGTKARLMQQRHGLFYQLASSGSGRRAGVGRGDEEVDSVTDVRRRRERRLSSRRASSVNFSRPFSISSLSQAQRDPRRDSFHGGGDVEGVRNFSLPTSTTEKVPELDHSYIFRRQPMLLPGSGPGGIMSPLGSAGFVFDKGLTEEIKSIARRISSRRRPKNDEKPGDVHLDISKERGVEQYEMEGTSRRTSMIGTERLGGDSGIMSEADDSAKQRPVKTNDSKQQGTSSLHLRKKNPLHPPDPETPTKTPLRVILSTVWPALNSKHRTYLIIGVINCVVVAGSTPAFSYFFANLLATLWYQPSPSPSSSPTPHDVAEPPATYNSTSASAPTPLTSLLVPLLTTTLLGTLSTFLSHYLLDAASQAWIDALRADAMVRILRQKPGHPIFHHHHRSRAHAPSSPAYRIALALSISSTSGSGSGGESGGAGPHYYSAAAVRDLLAHTVPGLLIALLMVCVSVVWAAAAASVELTAVGVGVGGLVLGLATSAYVWVSREWEGRVAGASDTVAGVVAEACGRIRTVKLLRLEGVFDRKHEKASREAFRVGRGRGAWTAVVYGAWQAAFWWVVALIFFYAVVLLLVEEGKDGERRLTVEGALQVVNLLVFGLGTAAGILAAVPGTTTAQVAAGHLLYYANLPLPPAITHGSSNGDGRVARRLKKKKVISPFPICLNRLDFTYPPLSPNTAESTLVLRNITFRIHRGTSTAIVGPSGCGKSTLASILLGLNEPTPKHHHRDCVNRSRFSVASTSKLSTPLWDQHMSSFKPPSQLTYSGVPYSQLDTESLMTGHMLYVPQHPFVFRGRSVAANITYGAPEEYSEEGSGSIPTLLSRDDIENCAKMAGIHEYIVGLERGYNTPVGFNEPGGGDCGDEDEEVHDLNGGAADNNDEPQRNEVTRGSVVVLSGGQARRLCIARALARLVVLRRRKWSLGLANSPSRRRRMSGILDPNSAAWEQRGKPVGLFVMDEPTAGLDRQGRCEVANLIRGLVGDDEDSDQGGGGDSETGIHSPFGDEFEIREQLTGDNGGREDDDARSTEEEGWRLMRSTVVVVTHCEEVMRAVERIVVLDRQGRVVEIGSYKELCARGGWFVKFLGRRRVTC